MDTNTVIELFLSAYIGVALLAPFVMLADLLLSINPEFKTSNTKELMIIFSAVFVFLFGSLLTTHILSNL